MLDAAGHTNELLERGYAVFESVYDREWVAEIRADIEDIHAQLGSPRCWSADARELAPGVVSCAAGLAVRSLFRQHARHLATLLHPRVVAALQGALGSDMVMEVAGCVVSDSSRPFFGWHMHVGGIDDGEYRRTGEWPMSGRSVQRVMTLTYLQDLTDDEGPMLIVPRKLGGSTAPPQPLDALDWDGQVELRVPAGSLVAVDECTWHAVRPKRSAGLRIFLGVGFRARAAPIGGWADTEIGELGTFPQASELLRSLSR